MPPLPAQHRWSARLLSAQVSCSRQRSTIEREIALLREFRTRLVADVVTGRVDVRWATPARRAESVADLVAGSGGEASPMRWLGSRNRARVLLIIGVIGASECKSECELLTLECECRTGRRLGA